MKHPLHIAALLALLLAPLARAEPTLQPNQRILVLGDSITAAGGYVEFIEAYLAIHRPGERYDIINLGLPSETITGLSEPYHPWPRPNVHERLGRAIEKARPDLVIACYGMNDGVYHPFAEERFKAYQDGINKLVADCQAAGAKVILVTPPPFDPQANPKQIRDNPDGSTELSQRFGYKGIYDKYDSEVLARYAAWIVERGKQDDVLLAIDVHTPINAKVAEIRKANPKFTMSGDGVHVDREGHRMIAAALLDGLGYGDVDLSDAALAKVMPLIAQRQKLRHAAWVSHVGHKRPGVKPGKPIDEAETEAAELTKQIEAAAAK